MESKVTKNLIQAKEKWKDEVLAELPQKDPRPFLIGDPNYSYTQIPARDGIAHGNIKRSNQWPNCSFFTNWNNLQDSITWESEVMADGDFEIEIYYTCPTGDVGSTVELSFNNSRLITKITKANDSKIKGMEYDRVPRIESYVKDFKPMTMGTIHLKKGKGLLTLKALDIPGSQVMDFRLLMLNRK